MDKGQIIIYHSAFRNFGDALSIFLVEYLSGQMVRRREFDSAEMSAVGSVLGKYFSVSCQGDVNKEPLKVWGTGMLEDREPEGDVCKRRGLEVFAVRGKETLGFLRKHGYIPKSNIPALGDPGLFYPDMIAGSRTQEKMYDLALVPHHMDIAAGRAMAERLMSFGITVRFVDVTSYDPSLCVLEIASARKVLSSSLHGLVVADALGIPNRRLLFNGYEQDEKRQYGQSNFKFRDYYSAFDLDLPEPITERMVDCAGASALALINNDDLVPCDKVDECRRVLLDAFPCQISENPRPFLDGEIARNLLAQKSDELTSTVRELALLRRKLELCKSNSPDQADVGNGDDPEDLRSRLERAQALMKKHDESHKKSRERFRQRESELKLKLREVRVKSADGKKKYLAREKELKLKLEEARSRNKRRYG